MREAIMWLQSLAEGLLEKAEDELAELEAQDISLAFTKARASHPERARELARGWRGRTTVKKVEKLA
jgi:hypothetical protein